MITQNLSHRRTHNLRRLEEYLIDVDIAVDDARREYLAALELVKTREEERDRIVAKLKAVIAGEAHAA